MPLSDNAPPPLRRTSAYRAVVSEWTGRLALACSGGIDSTALLVLAAVARDNGRIEPFNCLHVDHLSRPESRAEADTVADSCGILRVPFVRLTIDQGHAPDAAGPEEAMREARYGALARAVSALGLDGVATAHTRDDQVETILMRLMTGAGSVALSGMQSEKRQTFVHREITVVRPLLSVSRPTLLGIVEQAGLKIVADPSNEDVTIPRNRLRLRVIPEIGAAFPGFQTALARSVELARDDAGFLNELAQSVASTVVTYTGDAVLIDRGWIRREHPALTRRVIRAAILHLIESESRERKRELAFERIESVRAAASGRTGARIELPGGSVATVGTDTVRVEHGGQTFDKDSR